MQKSVLVVDDCVTVRAALAQALRETGLTVWSAEDGADAVRLLDQRGFDLVITDVNMPHLDGIGLTQYLRDHPRHRYTPVIVLTTDSQPERMLEGKLAGATGWMAKPFKVDVLQAVARRLIG